MEIKSTEQVIEQVTEQVQKLMDMITVEPKSANELMVQIGLKHKLTFRENYLKPALELGLILMTVPDKPRSSKQKYYKYKISIMVIGEILITKSEPMKKQNNVQ